MASSRCCGRQIEVSDSGQEMPCVCVRFPLEAPEPGTYCPYCDEPLSLVGYCGRCEKEC